MRKIKQTKMFFRILLILLIGGIVTQVHSHCQIPCGIYDDPARLKMISEHIDTIEKSMKQIVQLSQTEPVNMNQVVRWVNNKEHHTDELSEIVTYYFMAQRIKPVDADSAMHKKYIQQLTLLHEMLVTGMKCKQTTDLAQVEKLKGLLKEFSAAYQE
ncbi:MAG: superoxide dismutase [Ni] [Planctomycetota bacterium]|jgi:nickel superoxide dismutase